jgi:hypothetical protein
MRTIQRALRSVFGPLLGLSILLAGCASPSAEGETLPMSSSSLPPIDLAAPTEFATATFALG